MAYAIIRTPRTTEQRFQFKDTTSRLVASHLTRYPERDFMILSEDDAMLVAMRSDPVIRYWPLPFSDDEVDFYVNTNADLVRSLYKLRDTVNINKPLHVAIKGEFTEQQIDTLKTMSMEEFFAGCEEVREQFALLRHIEELRKETRRSVYAKVHKFVRSPH